MTNQEKAMIVRRAAMSKDLEDLRKALDEIDFSDVDLTSQEAKYLIGWDKLEAEPYYMEEVHRQGYTFETFMKEVEERESLNETIVRTENIEMLDEMRYLIKAHFDLYEKILKKGKDGTSPASESVKNTSLGQIKGLLQSFHKKIFNYDSKYKPGDFRTADDSLGVRNHFYVPNGEKFAKSFDKPIKEIQQVLRMRKTATNSEYVHELTKAYFDLYTHQLFHDGNSRTSKVMLNFLLVEKGLPISLSAASGLDEKRKMARDKIGYDQRVRHDQLAGDFEMKTKGENSREIIHVIKTDKDGNELFYPNGKVVKIFVYKDNNEVFEDKSIGKKGDWHKVLFNMHPLNLPEEAKEKLQYKVDECNGWQPLREVDYSPMEIVICRSILMTYSTLLKSTVDKENISR